jgi:hypothetical protein
MAEIVTPEELIAEFYATARDISESLRRMPEWCHQQMSLALKRVPHYHSLVGRPFVSVAPSGEPPRPYYDMLQLSWALTEKVDLEFADSVLDLVRKIQHLNVLNGQALDSDMRPSISVGFRDERWRFGYALMKRIPEPDDPSREIAKSVIEHWTEQAVAEFVARGQELPPHGPAEPWVNAANARDTVVTHEISIATPDADSFRHSTRSIGNKE